MKAASAFFTRNKKPGYKANMKLYTLHRILERISAANIYKTSSAFRSIYFLSIYSPCSLSLSLSLQSNGLNLGGSLSALSSSNGPLEDHSQQSTDLQELTPSAFSAAARKKVSAPGNLQPHIQV